MPVSFATRTVAAVIAAVLLVGCSSDDGPSVEEKLARTARVSQAGDTSYRLPALSRPPEFGARPDIETEGTLSDDSPTVFREQAGQGQGIPPRIAEMPGLSEGTRAFLARAVPAEASADNADRVASPELIDRLATGGDVTQSVGGREIRIERQTGWFD